MQLCQLEALAAPANWAQVNNDGFIGNAADDTGTELFVFGTDLYAYDSHGIYQMQLNPCLEWKQLTIPTTPGDWGFTPLGGLLYLIKGDQLWSIKVGEDFNKNNWVKVSSVGPSPGERLVPKAFFNGQIYAEGGPVDTFDIWRSQDVGNPVMQWSKVVSNGFNDPQNHGLAFMPIYNNKIMAVTNTLTGMFGNPSSYQNPGIEVWVSASGDPGSWTQVNQDGFGTVKTLPPQTYHINQLAGCWAVYKGHLYIGTKTNWGAEVWCYDGTGLNGWTKVTPPWAGPSPPGTVGGNPGRNDAMVEFENDLYLAEGYPTGSLARYDGTSWTQVVNSKDFDKTDGGFRSLATLDNKLYVATLLMPYSGQVRGDQVWGYPFSPGELPKFCPPTPNCMGTCVADCAKNCHNLPQMQKQLCIGDCLGYCDRTCP